MTNVTGILAVESVREFFEAAVHTAAEQHPQQMEPQTLSYLVDLLCEHLVQPPTIEQPMGLLIAASRFARPGRRVRQLKRVGDHALYIAGFFGPSLRRRQVDVDYYNAMGGTAYRRLSEILAYSGKDTSPRLANLYQDLSCRFGDFVDLLGEVRSKTHTKNDIGSIFEEWLLTGNSYLERRLRGAGMVLNPADAKNN